MTIGNRISQLRKSKNLSQEYLAEQLNVSRQAVSKWEKDLSNPGSKNLIRLSELFEVSVEYLVSGTSHNVSSLSTQEEESTVHSGALPKTLRKLSLIFFFLALASYLIGLFSGTFTDNLIPVFPYLWYGTSVLAFILLTVTFLFTVGWSTLLYLATRIANHKQSMNKT